MSEQPVQLLLTDAGTVTIVTGAAAWVIDKKTGKVIKVVPEMPGWERNLETMTAVAIEVQIKIRDSWLCPIGQNRREIPSY